MDTALRTALRPALRSGPLAGLLCIVACFVIAPAALASSEQDTPRSGWELTSNTFPTEIAPSGGRGAIELNLYNVGALGSAGQVTVTDTLPEGVVATSAGDFQNGFGNIGDYGLWECTGNGPGGPPNVEGATVVRCVNDPALLPSLPIHEERNSPFAAEEGAGAIEHIGIAIKATVTNPRTLTNEATITGGGAAGASSTSGPITVGTAPTGFGFQRINGWASFADGSEDRQAGSHPYSVAFNFNLNTFIGRRGLESAGGQPRNLAANLPPGLVGNPTAVPQCPREQFDRAECSPATQIGILVADVLGGEVLPGHAGSGVYNLVPPPGVPAQFGTDVSHSIVLLDATVRSGGDYGITVHADNIPVKYVTGSHVIIWGEPSDPAHDNDRYTTFGDGEGEDQRCRSGCASSAPRVPFLSLPTACGEAERTVATLDAWETTAFAEGSFLSHDAESHPAGLGGCDRLGFAPSLSAAPDTPAADSPAGLTVDVSASQESLTSRTALASSNIKDTTVVLPAGVVINPGQAAGLQACKQGDLPGGDDLPLAGENGDEGRFSGPPECPNASKVGTVKIATPLLKESVEGNVYVMQSNPPDLKLLLAGSAEGVNLKLIGDAELCETAGQVIHGKTCEAPGQIVTTFSNTPELPFTDFKLSFSGGAQAALDTPTQCGQYTTTSDFTPWSTPSVPDAFPSSTFAITSGPGGSPCPGAMLGFSPSMTAGSTSDQAGAFTDFSLLLERGDDQQRIEKLAFKQPAGLGGVIAGAPLCGEPQASQGTCSAASQIGHAVVASGPGPYPLVLPQPGAPELPIYLTGPYKGAPFGLSIVTPVVAGPFNLGTIVTRAKVEVDPKTVQISIVTDPLPQQVDGVPTDLRSIDSVIDRPNFIYNPSNCDLQEFTGSATSTQGAVAPLTSHFGMGSCRELEFHPKISGVTRAHASKANGAELHFNISYPKAPHGTQSWLKELKLDLPKQLPSRLTTIQQACLAATFETNRGACPAASIIGHATVHTPVLPVPLEGPMYDVSHGGAKFPDVVLVLKGDGVTLEEVGEVFIKNGITSTTFKAIPDAPFENVEVTLPAGPYSQFAANLPHNKYDFCGQTLKMPTLFVAQNGSEIHQSTPIGVTGCPKAHKAKKRHRKAHKANTHDRVKKSSGHFTSIVFGTFGTLDPVL